MVSKRMETIEGITDISSDRDPGGLQLTLKIDRQEGLGAWRACAGHRQRAEQRLRAAADFHDLYPAQPVHAWCSEIDPQFQRDPSDLERIFVAGSQRRAGAALQPWCAIEQDAGAAGRCTTQRLVSRRRRSSFNLCAERAAATVATTQSSSARSPSCICRIRYHAAASTGDAKAISTRPVGAAAAVDPGAL